MYEWGVGARELNVDWTEEMLHLYLGARNSRLSNGRRTPEPRRISNEEFFAKHQHAGIRVHKIGA